MRAPLLAVLLVLAALAPACGGAAASPRNEPKVRLQLERPADSAVVRTENVSISGSVKPAGATVQVLGREVAVSDGSFTADVPLEPGANLIDVAASAHGRRPDFAAMRVVREVHVAIPDVLGADADTTQAQLETLGLKVKRASGGGFLDPLLPGDPRVCESRPRAGAQVLPGTVVTLVTARNC